jgi:hypothetical protein
MKEQEIVIKFNENAPGRYWYLYWIGKITVDGNIFKVKLNFINTDNRDNFYNGYKSHKEYKQEVILPIEVLVFLTPGTIYDSKNNKLIYSSEYNKDERNVKIDFPFVYRKTKKIFPFLDSEYSILDQRDDLDGLDYYVFVTSKLIFNKKSKVKLFLTDYVLCKYFFFNSSKFLSLLMRQGIKELFDINNLKIITNDDCKRIGILKYNNNLLGKDDVSSIAHFFFMPGDKGIKSLLKLENEVLNFFVNERNNNEKLKSGIYLNTIFPFSENLLSVNIQGKEFNVDGQNYLIAERIIDHQYNPNLFLVDEIKIEEFFPKRSTDQKEDLNKTKVSLSAQPSIKGNRINLTSESLGNSKANIIDAYINSGNVSGFQFPVSNIIRDEQDKAYDVSLIPTERQLNRGTIINQGSEFDSDSVRNNFIDNQPSNSISRFELMRLTVRKLEVEYSVKCQFKCLSNFILSNNTYKISNHSVMIISLYYENKYFYLVEFNRGFTGFIHDKFMKRIDPVKLELFLKASINKIGELNKNQHIWTKIREFSEVILEKQGIVIAHPLKHSLLNYENASEAAFSMAKKIFNERILKIVA